MLLLPDDDEPLEDVDEVELDEDEEEEDDDDELLELESLFLALE